MPPRCPVCGRRFDHGDPRTVCPECGRELLSLRPENRIRNRAGSGRGTDSDLRDVPEKHEG